VGQGCWGGGRQVQRQAERQAGLEARGLGVTALIDTSSVVKGKFDVVVRCQGPYSNTGALHDSNRLQPPRNNYTAATEAAACPAAAAAV
jgi:hypothetical protein